MPTPGSIKTNQLSEQKPLSVEAPFKVKELKVEEITSKKIEETDQSFRGSFRQGLLSFGSSREKKFPSLGSGQQSDRQ